MSNAVAVIGSSIEIGGVAIAELGDIETPECKRDVIDVTNQASSGNQEEIVLGINRWSEMKFECNYLKSDSSQNATTGIIHYQQAGTLTTCTVRDAAGTALMSGNAYVMSFKLMGKIKDVWKMSVSVRPTGAWTFA